MPPPVNLLIEENTAFVAVPLEHGAAKFQERWWVKHCCMSVPGGGSQRLCGSDDLAPGKRSTALWVLHLLGCVIDNAIIQLSAVEQRRPIKLPMRSPFGIIFVQRLSTSHSPATWSHPPDV